jgi:hypothetical protein
MRIFKLYFDKDLEEQWINEMAIKGWALDKFFLGYYTFSPCKPGEYTYQIDLLDNWVGDRENFSSFMEEVGVEVVSQWYRWVYLRKLACDGTFEMYTDTESKIKQYRRMMHFFMVGAFLESLCLWVEINSSFQLQHPLIWGFTLLIAMLLLVFIHVIFKCRWKIQQLKKDFIDK